MGACAAVLLVSVGVCLAWAGGTTELRGQVTCRGVASCDGAVVYVERIPGRTYAPARAVMDQMRLTFVPHVLPIVTGTTVAFPNSDDVRHNVFSPSAAKRFNLGIYPAGDTRHVVFDRAGVVELLCNVHPEMSAYVLVIDTPFAATVGTDGAFAISGVPPGTYTVVAWHERLQPQRQSVTVGEGGTVVDFVLRP